MTPYRLLRTAFAVSLAVAPPAIATDATVGDFLAEVAQPIPGDDGAWIDPYVGDHRVVLVGEETHGIAEHIQLKAEVARRLLTHHGFTHIFVEDDVFKSDPLQANLRSETPQAATSFFREFFWCWNVLEMHDFFDDLTALPVSPIVLGLDVQTPRYATQSLRAIAETNEQILAVDALKVIFAGGRSVYSERTPEEKAADVSLITALVDTFAPIDIAREQRHLHRVRAVWTDADHGPRMNARDRGMAESVIDVLGRDLTSKAIILAHNAHVGYTPFYESFTGGVVPLGRHLRENADLATLSIGAVFTTGTRLLDPRSRERNGGPTKHHAEPPPDSQAQYWAAIPHDRWLLDLRAVSNRDAPAAIAEFFASPPEGYFNNYGPARALDTTYDLIVGYRTISPTTPPK